VKAYYARRAAEYDDWYEGSGLFAARERPAWEEDRDALVAAIAALPPCRTLDVACGTGYLTRHLRGEVTGLDQSEEMLAIARERLPAAELVQGDALPLPYSDDSFDRLFTGHFYGHLEREERRRFLAEAVRVAPELVVADSALRPGVAAQEWQERVLNDGSRHQVFKRFFDGEGLARELGGGEVLFQGRYFVLVRAALRTSAPLPPC
jgi:ubiquinone/menaquinone biosynthesis C-methylase UbiE